MGASVGKQVVQRIQPPMRATQQGTGGAPATLATAAKIDEHALPVVHLQGGTSLSSATTKTKAQTTTIPHDDDDDGYLASVEASQALIERGQEIHDEADRRFREVYNGVLGLVQKPSRADINRLGGKEPFLAIFIRFYEHLHNTPVLKTLFNESLVTRSAEEHGTLLGSFVLQISGYDRNQNPYSQLLREGKGHGLSNAHSRAKSCPHRPKDHQGRGFTWDQAHAWLGCIDTACKDRGAPDEFRDTLVHWLSSAMEFYGPMIYAR